SVSPTAENGSKLVNVKIILPKIKLRPNQTMTVRLPVLTPSGEDFSGVVVPLDAVTIGTEEQFVFVVKDGVAHKTNVTLGDVHGDRIEILYGLDSDATIVVEGSRTIADGQKVTVN
ncbi:MAG TPA: hypothetical protein VI588_00445, partial [Candidatus Gracilibacteria bacterium]|nr:hypothetical protein [Candidatus Gracilibacteria bacterium]